MPFVEQQPNNSQEWSLPDPEATHNQGWSSLDPETRHNLELGQVFVETDARAHDYDRTEEEYSYFHSKNQGGNVEFTADAIDGQANSEYVDSLVAEPVHEQAVNHEISIENRSVSTAEVATNSLLAQIEAYGKGIGEFRNGVVEQNRKR